MGAPPANAKGRAKRGTVTKRVVAGRAAAKIKGTRLQIQF
jgi:hypothetical protein